MAALNEKDLRAILGDDYLDKLNAAATKSGMSDEHRQCKEDRASMEDKKFPGLAFALVGACLIAAGFVTKDNTHWIQFALASLMVVAGLGWFMYVKRVLVQMDARIATMAAA
jgi:hypothetical protein